MKNGIVYTLLYLFFMFLTYVWRLSVFSAAQNGNVNIEDMTDFVNEALLINYIFLFAIAYYRGKAIDKKNIVIFPLIAGLFDIVLAFIPLVPTVMNIAAIIIGAQSKNNSKNEADTAEKDGNIDKLVKLVKLKESGAITEEEFAKEKEQLMKNI